MEWGSFEKNVCICWRVWENNVQELVLSFRYGSCYGIQVVRLGALSLSAKTILLTEIFETGSCFVVLESLPFNS